MSRRLPIFPLDVVLFPHTPLSLHIFEPRYRSMLADCMESDERFGIVPITADGATPPPGTVGSTAHVCANQQLPDGRSNIVVVGEERFVVRRYLDEPVPYAVAMVESFEDSDPGGVTDEQVSELRRLSQEYLEALHLINDSVAPETEFPEDTESFSFQVSAALDLDQETKQELLRIRATSERIRVLLRLMPPLVRELGERARIHGHARSNGKSHKSPRSGSHP